MLSEVNQTEKDKNHVISLMWGLKQKATNEQIKRNKQKTPRYRQQNGGSHRDRGWGKDELGKGSQIQGD